MVLPVSTIECFAVNTQFHGSIAELDEWNSQCFLDGLEIGGQLGGCVHAEVDVTTQDLQGSKIVAFEMGGGRRCDSPGKFDPQKCWYANVFSQFLLGLQVKIAGYKLTGSCRTGFNVYKQNTGHYLNQASIDSKDKKFHIFLYNHIT